MFRVTGLNALQYSLVVLQELYHHKVLGESDDLITDVQFGGQDVVQQVRDL